MSSHNMTSRFRSRKSITPSSSYLLGSSATSLLLLLSALPLGAQSVASNYTAATSVAALSPDTTLTISGRSDPEEKLNLADIPRESALLRGNYSVVIDISVRKLFFVHNKEILWSAPVGIGTGLRLEKEDGEWEFSTPRGRFSIGFRELNPVWIAPDWHFIEKGLPVPPDDSPARRFPGALGDAALYFGPGLAIHGTEHPDLLGRAVSHGCIRLSNANILRLSQAVHVGTEVLIIGTQRKMPGDIESIPKPGAPKPPPSPLNLSWARYRSSLETTDNLDLLRSADALLKSGEMHALGAKWVAPLNELLSRGLEGDAEALDLLLLYWEYVPSAAEPEYYAILSYALERAPFLTLEALSRVERPMRDRIAESIVRSTMLHYQGDAKERVAPWPTRRFSAGVEMSLEAELGLVAIRYAERAVQRERGII